MTVLRENIMRLDFDHDDTECVYFDLETQSRADLKAVGGRKYTSDPSTRVLTADFLIDGVHRAWVPSTLWWGPVPEMPLSLVQPADCSRPVVVHQCPGLPARSSRP